MYTPVWSILFLIRFWCSKMGFLWMPDAMAQARGLSTHSLAHKGPKSDFWGIFSMCPYFLTLPSVLLSFWDIILCLEKCSSKCQGILFKNSFFFTFFCSLQKPQEWAEGNKKWAKSPGTWTIVFGIPKNRILDTKIIKIQFGENKIHFSKNVPFLSLL